MEGALGWDQVPALMGDLRAMAQALLLREGNAQSLQPTALVLTALRRQKAARQDWGEVTWETRDAFFGAVYTAMMRALIDHARKRKGQRRHVIRTVQAGDLQLHDLVRAADEEPEQVEALRQALEPLEAAHPEWALVVKHRFFGGQTVEETAALMGRGEKTIRRWWEQARVLLCDEVLRLLNGAREGGQ